MFLMTMIKISYTVYYKTSMNYNVSNLLGNVMGKNKLTKEKNPNEIMERAHTVLALTFLSSFT